MRRTNWLGGAMLIFALISPALAGDYTAPDVKTDIFGGELTLTPKQKQGIAFQLCNLMRSDLKSDSPDYVQDARRIMAICLRLFPDGHNTKANEAALEAGQPMPAAADGPTLNRLAELAANEAKSASDPDRKLGAYLYACVTMLDPTDTDAPARLQELGQAGTKVTWDWIDGQDQSAPPAPPPGSTAQVKKLTLPTFGLEFVVPTDTTFELTDSPTHIGLWRFNPDSPNAGAALLVENMAARGHSLPDIAARVAALGHASTDPGTYTIGGEAAVKLSADFNLDTFTHRVTYLALHADRAYFFSVLTSPGCADASQKLEDLIASVRFFQPESPLKHLNEFFRKPITIFGRITMNGPNSLRRTNNDPADAGLEIMDCTGADDPISIDIRPFQFAKPITFAQFRDAYSAGLEKSFSISEHFVWHVSDKIPGLNFTQPHKITESVDGTSHTAYSRMAILDLGQGYFVQFAFTSLITADDQADQAYNDAEVQMLETIQILPKPATP
jgi:hypothetical protein